MKIDSVVTEGNSLLEDEDGKNSEAVRISVNSSLTVVGVEVMMISL